MKRFKELYFKYKEVINYLIFGVLATILNLGVKYILLFTILDAAKPIQLQIAVIISWIVACLFAYFTNRIIVFKSESKKILKEVISFFTARLVTLGMEMFIMFIFITVLGLNSNLWVAIWSLVAQVVVIVSNYIFSKLIIFKKKEE
jgi:putative flippase GtrA